MNDIVLLIEKLRLARDMANDLARGDTLYLLLNQALEEALAEARRRDIPVPPEVPRPMTSEDHH